MKSDCTICINSTQLCLKLNIKNAVWTTSTSTWWTVLTLWLLTYNIYTQASYKLYRKIAYYILMGVTQGTMYCSDELCVHNCKLNFTAYCWFHSTSHNSAVQHRILWAMDWIVRKIVDLDHHHHHVIGQSRVINDSWQSGMRTEWHRH